MLLFDFHDLVEAKRFPLIHSLVRSQSSQGQRMVSLETRMIKSHHRMKRIEGIPKHSGGVSTIQQGKGESMVWMEK